MDAKGGANTTAGLYVRCVLSLLGSARKNQHWKGLEMTRVLAYALAAALSLSASFVSAQEMGIVTGAAGGTYLEIGKNISDLVRDEAGIQVTVHPSEGSLQNAYDVRRRRGIQLGIVQSDVLAFLRAQRETEEIRDIVDRLRMVFPLYNEEVQVVASYDFETFDDLSKATVAVGPKGSGTFLTSSLLFEITGVEPAEISHLSGREALEALKNGKIDAMVYVAGAPTALFAEGIVPDDKLHLLNINASALRDYYIPVIIEPGTYAWQTTPAETIAVKAMLISYDFRNMNCQKIGELSRIVYRNIDRLRASGHKKWQSVELDATVPGWQQYDCVRNALFGNEAAPLSVSPKENPILREVCKTQRTC
jgi:uncharacterized protein